MNKRNGIATVLWMGLVLMLTGCNGNKAEQSGITDVLAETNSQVESEKYFIKGADISSLEAVEDCGGKFYDFEGNEVDVIDFLGENGCNYYRLRIWNNPTLSFDAGDYCNLEHTVEMAKRIKESGADYLLDFHYSDWWADPKNQEIPDAWKEMNEEELSNAVYEYTTEVLNALEQEDAFPDMVQIGNEIGNGMLWPYGSTDNPKVLATFLNSGIKAVRDTTPTNENVQIMIHVETGGSVGATEKFFTMIQEQGVTDYDIVGLSYYPYWQGTFADMKENINNIYEKFQKKVILAETAYAYTNDNADDKSNMVSDAELKAVGFEATPENQKLVFELIMNAVAECEGGLGVFYWEPAWLPIEGVGVAQGNGNEWENQLLFDFSGKALEAVKAFGFVPGAFDNDIPLYVYPFDGIEVDMYATGDAVLQELPQTAKVLYMDGSIRDVEVVWDIQSKKVITDTRVAYKGNVLDEIVSIGAELVEKNALNNLDFEEGVTGWIEEDSKKAGKICNDESSYPHSGEWSYHYWNADAFEINLYQQVKIDKTEQYNLQLWSQGIGDSELFLELYIADKEGNEIASTEFKNTGWNEWQHPCVSASLMEGDIVQIGIKIHAGSDDWGTLDNFSFYVGDVKSDTELIENENENGSLEIAEVKETGALQNASFENGENGWKITRNETGSGTVRNDKESYPHSGEYSFHYWDDSDFSIELQQEVIIAESGEYCISAFSQGDAETDTYMTLYVMNEDGKIIESVEFENEGWSIWQTPVLENVSLQENQIVVIGIIIHGKANGWGTIDDIRFIRQ